MLISCWPLLPWNPLGAANLNQSLWRLARRLPLLIFGRFESVRNLAGCLGTRILCTTRSQRLLAKVVNALRSAEISHFGELESLQNTRHWPQSLLSTNLLENCSSTTLINILIKPQFT